MTIKIGVGVKDVSGRLYDILPMVERCVAACGCESSIITATRSGENGRLKDRLSVLVVDLTRKNKAVWVCRNLKEWLGPNYNIVKDCGLIRIKWDPKREKGNEK